MYWLDITILVALGIGAVFGFWSGLLWQIARVVCLFLSLYSAAVANSPIADWLEEQWQDADPAVGRTIAFIGVFLVAYITLYCFTCLIHKAIRATQLELVDRLLGSLLGVIKLAAVTSGVCAGLTALAMPMTQEWLENSTLAPHFAQGADVIIGMIPRDVRDRVDDNLQQARDQLGKKVTRAVLEALKK